VELRLPHEVTPYQLKDSLLSKSCLPLQARLPFRIPTFRFVHFQTSRAMSFKFKNILPIFSNRPPQVADLFEDLHQSIKAAPVFTPNHFFTAKSPPEFLKQSPDLVEERWVSSISFESYPQLQDEILLHNCLASPTFTSLTFTAPDILS
jgi:hypothetical protein